MMDQINAIKKDLIALCEKYQIAIVAHAEYDGYPEIAIHKASGSIDAFDYRNKIFISELFCPKGSMRRYPKDKES